MGDVWRRWGIPAAIGIARAAAFLAVVGIAAYTAHASGLWYPQDPESYLQIAIVCAINLAFGRLLPVPLLVLTASFVGNPLWLLRYSPVRDVPIVIIAYFAADAGVPLWVVLPVALVGAALGWIPGWNNLWPNIGDIVTYALEGDLSTWAPMLAVAVAAALLGFAAHRRRGALERLKAQNEELVRLRASDRERIANEERSAIAREIHDVVTHHMAAIVVRAQAAARVADQRPDEPRAAIEWIAESGRTALAELRGVVRVLRGGAGGGSREAPVALTSALDDVVARVRSAGVDVRASIDTLDGLTALQEFAVLRVCQEALTNVLIHSGAKSVDVRFGASGADAALVVDDDGALAAGRTPGRAATGEVEAVDVGGAGLRGMRERAEAVGGRVAAGPTERGWRVELVMPIGARAAGVAQ